MLLTPPEENSHVLEKRDHFKRKMNDLPTIINLWFSEVMVVFRDKDGCIWGSWDYNPLINTPTLEAVHPCLSPDGWGAPFVGRFHLQVSLGEIPASNLAHNRKHEFHQPPILVVFWCFLEGKMGPRLFQKRSRLVKYYSIWPDVSMIGLLLIVFTSMHLYRWQDVAEDFECNRVSKKTSKGLGQDNSIQF